MEVARLLAQEFTHLAGPRENGLARLQVLLGLESRAQAEAAARQRANAFLEACNRCSRIGLV